MVIIDSDESIMRRAFKSLEAVEERMLTTSGSRINML